MTMQGMRFGKGSGQGSNPGDSRLTGSGKKSTASYPKGKNGSKPGPRKRVG